MYSPCLRRICRALAVGTKPTPDWPPVRRPETSSWFVSSARLRTPTSRTWLIRRPCGTWPLKGSSQVQNTLRAQSMKHQLPAAIDNTSCSLRLPHSRDYMRRFAASWPFKRGLPIRRLVAWAPNGPIVFCAGIQADATRESPRRTKPWSRGLMDSASSTVEEETKFSCAATIH